MTHLCYTLEEAARKLKFSETVLVRLSQYFKVPRAAYEETGYLSFKGDLMFSDPDLAFFQQVKERLVAGQSLEEVKRRMRDEKSVLSAPMEAPASSGGAPMQEILDERPYQQAAQRDFERYKSTHRASGGLSKVFESMLKEVGVTGEENAPPEKQTKSARKSRKGTDTVLPFRSLRQNVLSHQPETDQPEPIMEEASSNRPFKPVPTVQGSATRAIWNPVAADAHQEEAWERIIRQAASRPRALNNRLKNAALLLQQEATGQIEPQPSASS